MSQLKAFELELNEEVAASDASKARYLIYSHLRDMGFKVAATGKPWPALTDLRIVRAQGYDAWAKHQQRPRHITSHYANLERAQLPTA